MKVSHLRVAAEDSAARGARPVKRSFTIAGHRTSVSLEAAFWDALKAAAEESGRSTVAIVAQIDAMRGGAGLSSAVRVWLLQRAQAGKSETLSNG